MVNETLSTRERLILAGMEELREHGMNGFSLRRVSTNCGVSCAAPYKHFRDKQDLFTAMADYIHAKWTERIRGRLSLEKPVEEVIADFAAEHVAFLVENPDFKAVLLIKETGLDTPLAARAMTMSVLLSRLFVICRRKFGYTREEIRERIFMVRTIMYGASMIMSADDNDREVRLAVVRDAVMKGLRPGQKS
ncbi:MAG: TetR/AcrR family transcriptional regulator [Clostridia bacterium]|nr:TetR/AcrR family transcriptional regulator [Clostridia bacterium]